MYQEFDRLLEEQSPIEAYIEWLDSMVDRCVVKVRQQILFFTHFWKQVFKPDLTQHFCIKCLSFVQVAQIKFIYFFLFDAEE